MQTFIVAILNPLLIFLELLSPPSVMQWWELNPEKYQSCHKNFNIVIEKNVIWVFLVFFNIWDRGVWTFLFADTSWFGTEILVEAGCLCSILGSLDLATNKFVQGWSSSSVCSAIFHIKSGKIKLMSSLFFKMSALD